MNRIPFPDMKYPLVAILRGLTPAETPAAIEALLGAGFRAIEIPLNSPDPFKSIEIAVKMAPADALIGAGTILTKADVDRLDDVGGRLFVSPNVDVPVLSHAVSKKMVTLPGIFTPTEALAAAATGATGLKFFPAGALGPSGITAIRTVLPPDLLIAAVGGVSDQNFGDYAKVGIKAFGLGSSLYQTGMDARDIAARAKATIDAYDRVFGA
ncbi:2-dehydro-3-deoxy-6-phosphogalactonate aldolase [Rhizobium sp. KVB221]|uniref:2-dehydro-3-deoxy-6-phosphogalactonate aldolase n=1 Tax=Rhizobium setariae TaxID=2801340 RepID=A0A936YI86_9HYPH|nr:2-dehydro-3-deoxy-6-phosphogalactonate aldolase [Rhizobium setariae]MBL0370739.1 2-dehydro-3-deoxy-6-phosphogalactonate aldolase [Rhizobium setariae]